MPQPFLETSEQRFLISRFDINHPVRREPGRSERWREQILAGDAPQHATRGPCRDPCCEECSGSPVCGAVTAARHLMQRAERQPTFRQTLVNGVDAKWQDRPPLPRPALKASNALTKRLDDGSADRGKPGIRLVIAGLVPAISIGRARCLNYRDGRDKPGHDRVAIATRPTFKALNALAKRLHNGDGDRCIHIPLQLAWGPACSLFVLIMLRSQPAHRSSGGNGVKDCGERISFRRNCYSCVSSETCRPTARGWTVARPSSFILCTLGHNLTDET